MVQSESLKRAKAKYYQKMKEDPDFIKKNAEKAKEYFEQHRDRKKIDDVTFKLQQIDTEQLAKILIAARKTRLLEL
jgi:hypothetical protein